MFEPPFEALGDRQAQLGLSDGEVAHMLGMTVERFQEICTPGSHDLPLAETTAIIELSRLLGSLMTIIKPQFIREWLTTPNYGSAYEGRIPADVIAAGDAGPIDRFIDGINHGIT